MWFVIFFDNLRFEGADPGPSHKFAIGDVVEVEGKQNLRGTIIAINRNKITVISKQEELKDPMEFQAHQLNKLFSPGDRVRVTDGPYEYHTGWISTVETDVVVLFSDQALKDIEVHPENLHIARGKSVFMGKRELNLGSVRIVEVIFDLTWIIQTTYLLRHKVTIR